MRYLIFALLLTACGVDGPPPAGQTEGSPSIDGFTPPDY